MSETLITLPDRKTMLESLRKHFERSSLLQDFEKKHFPELLCAAGITLAPKDVITLVIGTVALHGPNFPGAVFIKEFIKAILQDPVQAPEILNLYRYLCTPQVALKS